MKERRKSFRAVFNHKAVDQVTVGTIIFLVVSFVLMYLNQ